MSFKITPHNLEHVLNAYQNHHQPKNLTVPYDRYGNEIEIPAPQREEIELALKWYDTRQMMQQSLSPNYRWHFSLFDTIHITNKNKPEVEREIISPGLAIIHFGKEYQLEYQYDCKTGFPRVVGYSPKNQSFSFWPTTQRRVA